MAEARAMLDIVKLLSSGKLQVLATELGVDIGNAFAAYAFICQTTQEAREESVTDLQIKLLIGTRLAAFCPAVKLEKMLPAMVTACLAEEISAGVWYIKGNRDRIAELDAYHNSKVESGRRGGLQKSLNAKKTQQIPVANPSESYQSLAKPSAVAVAVAVAVEDQEQGRGNADSLPRPVGIHPPPGEILRLEKIWLSMQDGIPLRGLIPSQRNALMEIWRAAGDATEIILRNYRADNREYYAKRKWPLTLLAENIDEHRNTTSSIPKDGGSKIAKLAASLEAEAERRRVESETNPLSPKELDYLMRLGLVNKKLESS